MPDGSTDPYALLELIEPGAAGTELREDGEERVRGRRPRESAAGAIARTLVGLLAVVFQRPIRLFRPMHFSSFSLIDMLARREGKKLGIPFLRRLVRQERPIVLLSLIVPPMLANLAIGFTLFQTYTLTERRLMPPDRDHEPFRPTWVVGVAGAVAGAAQCVISAPLDNIRLVLQPWLLQDSRRGGAPKRMSFKVWTLAVEAAFLPFLPERLYRHVMQRLQRPQRVAERSTSTVFQYLPTQARRLARRQHGMSLTLSLLRDAAGFAGFFITFEWARRAAQQVSRSVDSAVRYARRAIGHGSSLYPTEDARTVAGRVSAALVLVLGGAVGALLYGWISRPIEYVRIVLWHRLYVPQTRPHAPSPEVARTAVAHLAPLRRAAALHTVCAVRARAPVPRVSFVQTQRRLRVQRRRMPLALGPADTSRGAAVRIVRAPRARRGTRERRERRERRWPVSQTWRRLMQFARMTAPPRLLGSPTRLFLHTYVLRPFIAPELCKPNAPRPWGTGPPVRHPHTHLERRGSVIPTWAWLRRRLLTPYACGFLVYAYLSGDLH